MTRSTPCLITVLLLAATLANVSPASAEETVCRRALGAVTVDNLRVPSGATCTLDRTFVKGTIKVERGATLQARQVRVIGNVQGEGAANVRILSRSLVGGSVQIVQGGAAVVDFSTISGDVLYDSNNRRLAVTRSIVGGNVQAFKNIGGLEISDNDIDGNLQCKENRPRPTGGRNVVQGNKEDQCARL